MPSLAIHVSVAKEYLKSHKCENVSEFFDGTFAPDVAADKNAAHFSGAGFSANDVETVVKNKINIEKAAQSINLDNEFNRARFLHLLTDYFFYAKMPEICRRNKITDVRAAIKILIDDYVATNAFLAERYAFDLNTLPDDCRATSNGEPQIMSKAELCDFISEMSKCDLEKLHKKFRKSETKQ
jgi:hypothetical protein